MKKEREIKWEEKWKKRRDGRSDQSRSGNPGGKIDVYRNFYLCESCYCCFKSFDILFVVFSHISFMLRSIVGHGLGFLVRIVSKNETMWFLGCYTKCRSATDHSLLFPSGSLAKITKVHENSSIIEKWLLFRFFAFYCNSIIR